MPTILIAEDSATQAAALSYLLEEQGYDVQQARNGLEALSMAQKDRPDLIISDIVMPKMDGYTLCRTLKKDKALQSIPFILVTSLSSPQDVFKGLDVGADNFIVKPYDSDLLLSRIRYLLTNLELRKSGKLQVGIEIELSGQRHFITAERQQILDLLISTYEQAVRLNEALESRQRELAKSYDTLNALYGFADDLNRCHSETDVAEAVVDRGLTLPGVRAAWMYLKDGDQIRLAASKSKPEGFLAFDDLCRDCQGHKLLQSGAVAAPASMVECAGLSRQLGSDRPCSHASVLLTANDAPLGVLNLVASEHRAFTEEELKMLSSIGHQIATALERAHLHEVLERKVQDRTAALRQANAELSTILESSPGAIVAMEQSGAVVTWNRAAEAIFGYSQSEMLGRRDLLPIGLDIEQDPWAKELSEAGTVRSREVKGRRKDESPVDARLSGALLYDPDDRIRGRVIAFEDQTERKRVEDQLRQAQKMEAIGNLTGGIAHDFNNLLTVSIGNIDLLSTVIGDNPAARDLIEGALDASLRGADLTRHLLAFGRRQALKPAIVDVNRLIAGMVKLLTRTLGEHIAITLVDGKDLWPVLIDAAQLDSAIVNMSVNARDAMPDGGMLTIETANTIIDENSAEMFPGLSPGDYVTVSVTDTGTGMSPEILARVFEPFFTTKETDKGTGLGLAMVYGFVKQSGGHVTVYSEVGAGTTFRLYLPRAMSDAVVAQPEVRADLSKQRKSGRILVVEDNESVRKLVSRQLSDLGYKVIAAANAEEALAAMEREEQIDLVFSDVVMPGKMNGIKLAEEIEKRWPAVRVLLTSGFPEAALGRSNGHRQMNILGKPYRVRDLAEAVYKLLHS